MCLIQTHFDIIEQAKTQNIKIDKICLPDKNVEHGDACWAVGWHPKENLIRNEFVSIGLNIFSNDYCENHRFILKKGFLTYFFA